LTLESLNKEPKPAAVEALLRCCGSRRWAEKMAEARPFSDENALFLAADRIWNGLTKEDWLEAFSHHPKIGQAPEKKHSSTASWAKDEQAGTKSASASVLDELAALNREYDKKFGHVYLICATGKTADEMLGILKSRLGNRPEAELKIAAGEQAKITRIRLEKLLKS